MGGINLAETGKTLREALNDYTVEYLSEILNVSRSVIYYWFSGRNIPSVENMVKICSLLNCRIEDLIIFYEDSEVANCEYE